MPKIVLEKDFSAAPQEVFSKVKSILSDDKDLRKLDPNYKCQFQEANLSGTAKGSQFEAQMEIKPGGSGSHLKLVVSLPMLLTPFKGFVEKTLKEKIEKVIG